MSIPENTCTYIDEEYMRKTPNKFTQCINVATWPWLLNVKIETGNILSHQTFTYILI